jgi:hypothetical protein
MRYRSLSQRFGLLTDVIRLPVIVKDDTVNNFLFNITVLTYFTSLAIMVYSLWG